MHREPSLNPDRVRRFLTPLLSLSLVLSAYAQVAPQPDQTLNNEKKSTMVPVAADDQKKENEAPLELSPFTVTTAKDSGYFAANTLAGTRLNTNVQDLASSITVVTKQQLVDTSSVDINDVFMYEASTEGANTYTQTDVSRNGVPRDTIAGYSSDAGDPSTRATANRVRGLSAADPSQNNYAALGRVPFDSYNTNSLEISRGPNSLIFGTGSPAGIVNQSTAQAVLNQRQTHVEARYGSWNDRRFTFSHNQPLLKDRAAIYVAGLWSDTGFRRKPSDDTRRRQYVAFTVKPLDKTVITASYEHYDEWNNSPNAQTPRDYVTPWLNAGRPGYDPLTRSITIMDTGAVIGPYVTSSLSPGYINATATNTGTVALTSTTSPQYVPGMQFGITGSTRVTLYQEPTGILYFQPVQGVQSTSYVAPYTAYNAPATGSRTAAQWMVADRRLTSSAGPLAPAGIGTFIQPSVTNQAIYDWEHINLLQMNYGMYDAGTSNVEIQQQILPNLFASAGWFRQSLDADENYTVSNANAITTLYVDTNLKTMDGQPNPHFGSPFLADISPDKFLTPEVTETYRAMLAYELDLTKLSGWRHWLGRHRILALASDQANSRKTFRYRYTMDGGDTRWQAAPTAANAIIASSNFTRLFYVGSNDKGVVDYSPGLLRNPNDGGPNTAIAKSYNWSTGTWDQSDIHMSQMLFYAGKYGLDQREIVGKSAAISSYFWDDRIVTTFGVRKDNYKARTTNTAGKTTTNSGKDTDLYVNGVAIDPSWTDNTLTDWFRLDGTTHTSGIVARVWRFNGGEVSLHFNKSDNFNPPAGIPVDFYGVPLPKSTGRGKDYGIGVSMFDSKLVATLNWYDSDNKNAPATAATTAIGRVSRMDTSSFRSWAEYVVRIRTNLNGEANMDANRQLIDPQFANNSAAGHALTQQMKNEIASLMQIATVDNWPPTGIGGTQTNKSKGLEFQLTYNPLRNWNIKVTATKVKATYEDVAPQIDAWLGDGSNPTDRLYVWQHAAVTDIPDFTLQSGTPIRLSSFWNGYGFNADARLSNASGATPQWTSPAGFYESAVATEINTAKALQGKTVPNEREWSFNLLSNYTFLTGRLRGVNVGGSLRWADQAIAGFYGDPNNLDSSGLMNAPDLSRPIYAPSETHVDFWVGYSRKIFSDKVRWKLQLNVRDAFEGGKLQPIAYNFDGSAFAYRIVDPRQYFVTSTFDF
ncbi:MAG TPA: TonB-dependent receptor plug domain-containing protein [Lacunisphaera sp.]|nr:TonB-dependent receptor plug domain-containing protein [Lacunisphaera sp.]